MEKSTGWNTLLPMPPITAAPSSIGKFCARPASAAPATHSASPVSSTRRAPKRSTAKPASVWQTPETV